MTNKRGAGRLEVSLHRVHVRTDFFCWVGGTATRSVDAWRLICHLVFSCRTSLIRLLHSAPSTRVSAKIFKCGDATAMIHGNCGVYSSFPSPNHWLVVCLPKLELYSTRFWRINRQCESCKYSGKYCDLCGAKYDNSVYVLLNIFVCIYPTHPHKRDATQG